MGYRCDVVERWLAKIVVFLLLGAIVNVAVAWTCQLKFESSPPLPVDTEHQFRGWEIWSWNALGAQEIGNVIGGSSSEYIASLEQWEPPAWSRLRQLPIYEKLDPVDLQADRAFGLPALSVWYGLDAKRALGTSLVLSREVTGCLPYRDLAVTPIWPGFAINTASYAAILWLITLGPLTARRIIRRKQGRCIKCGYDLRGEFASGCPECGWRRGGLS